MSSDLGPILITGGTGFLGSHLARFLASSGLDVHVLARPQSSLWRIEDLLDQITIWRGDLMDCESIRECVLACRPSTVFHLAGDTALRSLDAGLENVERSLDTLHGTIHLLEELHRGGIPTRCLVRSGGLEEYGQGPHPYCETQREAPVSPYSAVQVATTHYSQMLQRVLRFPVVTLRLALLYGPAQSASFFIPSLITHCLENRDYAMTTGEQGRDFLFVGDAMAAFVAVAQTKGLAGEVINIGSGQEYRIGDVAEAIRLVTGTRAQLRLGAVAARQSEIRRLVCRNDKARRLLHWQPRTSLEEGLLTTVSWYRQMRTSLASQWREQ